jgi:glycosyltransferase involved in cell wall biosynthesis
LRNVLKAMLRKLQGAGVFDWLRHFDGPKESFTRSLEQLQFGKGEIVIAVGEHAVEDVHRLKRDVFKVRYCHGFFDHLPELNRVAWGVPMATLAVSPALVARLEGYSGEAVLGIVPNGIKTEEYFVEPSDRQGLGLIFHQIPVKGPEAALAIVKAAQQRFPERVWHAFGTAQRPQQFDKVQYTRYPGVGQARAIYNRCKVWVVTSRQEGFCLPILEAMSCGCAVVSSNNTAAPELISDGVNGYIVEYGDTKAYLQRIETLLSNESKRLQMVQEGFTTVKRYRWEDAVMKLEQVLERVVQGPAPQELIGPPG